ncbi:chondroitinase-B domain-containing protein [Pedobacter sp. UC225_65]|uniref:chondroitinase-B domain-containing protein n=1 Tax=Pedobacter sp. UC225_65 TaxID=3350173 RepID=UPI0036717E04
MKKTVLYSLFLILLSVTANAHTYRINSEMQLKAILDKLVAGDEVIIANGTYTNWGIIIANKGTEAKPIVIKAETAGKVVFSGDVDQTLFKVTGDFVVLSGFSFNNCNLTKTNGKTGVLIEFKDTKNCRLTASTFIKNKVNAQFMPLVMISGKDLTIR